MPLPFLPSQLYILCLPILGLGPSCRIRFPCSEGVCRKPPFSPSWWRPACRYSWTSLGPPRPIWYLPSDLGGRAFYPWTRNRGLQSHLCWEKQFIAELCKILPPFGVVPRGEPTSGSGVWGTLGQFSSRSELKFVLSSGMRGDQSFLRTTRERRNKINGFQA